MQEPNLLTEHEVKTRMEIIAGRYPEERKAMRDAYTKIAASEATARLAIAYGQLDKITNPDVREYIKNMDKVKLLASDKEALLALEVPALVEYDLAKRAVEDSDKEFDKLNSLLIYSQALMKFTGQTEKYDSSR